MDVNINERNPIEQFLQVITDKTCLQILGRLADDENTSEALGIVLDLSDDEISHHLAILIGAKLVKARPYNGTALYTVNQKALETLSQKE